MFRARLRARLCRGKEGLHRAPTFVRQFDGYTHHLLLFLSSTHYCPFFHPLLSEIYPLLTTLRPSKGGLKRQSLLQTWCGSAPRRGPSANGYDAWRFGSCGPGRKILATAAADLVWVCAPPRTIRKWLRRLAFWILRTRAQDPCSCCCRPGVGLRPAADHPQMVTTPGVLDPRVISAGETAGGRVSFSDTTGYLSKIRVQFRKKVAIVGCTQAISRLGRVKTSVDQSAALIPAG